MDKTVEIALAFPRGVHQENCLEGIRKYATDQKTNWSFITAPESLFLSIASLQDWDGDGVIAAVNTAREAEAAAEMKIPVLNISSSLVDSPVPRVNVDNRRVGELAAEHLLSRGFNRYVFYGLEEVAYSQLREAGFRDRLREAGIEVERALHVAPTFGREGSNWQGQHRQLEFFLRELSRTHEEEPVGIFAVTDFRARQTIDVCRHLEIDVPRRFAVLGVDDEDFICKVGKPTLSSVARDNFEEGYQAASKLHQMLLGGDVAASHLVPPIEVVARESTNSLAVSDPRVRRAIDYINQHLDAPIDVGLVSREMNVSRRWLEYSFRDAIGESPYQYIRQRRLELAKSLLEQPPKIKLGEVARRCGFSSAKQLSMAFREWQGKSPRDYRQAFQHD